MRLFLSATAIFSLASCASIPSDFSSGYYVQRSGTDYQIVVGNWAHEPTDYFYHGAYDICLLDHHTGFSVITLESRDGSVGGLITCKGTQDEYLKNKYQGTHVRREPSDFMGSGGFHYVVEPDAAAAVKK
jgi:hypothetical protein